MKTNHLSLDAGVLCVVLPAGAASAQAAASTLLSQNRLVTALLDGSTSTWWASVRDSHPQWIYIDLGATAAPTTPANLRPTGTASDSVSLAWDASTTVTRAPTSDTEPPSSPGNLRSTGVTSSTPSLAWDASTDNVGVSVRHLRDDRPEGPVAGGAGLQRHDHGHAGGARDDNGNQPDGSDKVFRVDLK
jgi:hypothetical protein